MEHLLSEDNTANTVDLQRLRSQLDSILREENEANKVFVRKLRLETIKMPRLRKKLKHCPKAHLPRFSAKMQELEHEHSVAEKYLEDCYYQSLRLKARKQLETYAKLSCRALCKNIYDTLPREVRDKIYKHILVRERLNLDEWTNGLKYNAKDFNHYKRQTWELYIGPTHCCDRDYMSSDVLTEVAETWYETTAFELDSCGLYGIEEFVSTDVWELGLRPRDLIGHVLVRVAEEALIAAENSHTYADRDDVKPWDWVERSWKCLEDLFLLKHRASITIRVQSLDGRVGVGSLEEAKQSVDALDPFMRIIRRLKEKDYRVQLWLDGVCLTCVGSSPEEWMEKIKEHNAAIRY